MKIFLIKNTDVQGYCWGQFVDAVVVAVDEEAARKMHPGGDDGNVPEGKEFSDSWASSPERVCVRYLGEAAESIVDPWVVTAYLVGEAD